MVDGRFVLFVVWWWVGRVFVFLAAFVVVAAAAAAVAVAVVVAISCSTLLLDRYLLGKVLS